MRGTTRRAVILFILIAFAVGWVYLMGSGTAQPGVATAPDGSTASVVLMDADSDFPAINVHVLVLDGTGEPVKGLGRGAFELTEDGIPVKMDKFLGAGQQAVTAVLVIDHSGSMDRAGKIEGAREAAKVFVSIIREDLDSLGITVFNDNIDTLSPVKLVAAADKDVLTRQIEGVGADGGTAFHDAVYEAVNQLQRVSGRKVVIALTDGKDEDSRRSVDQAITFAQDKRIPVYTVGLGSGDDIDTVRLARLADETGGEFHQAPTADQLAELYRRIGEALQNEYVFSYLSPTPELDGTQREVVINIEHGGGILSTNQTYAVGGIIKAAFNYPFFGALLLLLLFLLMLPNTARRVSVRRRTPEVVPPVPYVPFPDVAPSIGPTRKAVDPVPPVPVPEVALPAGPAPQPVEPTPPSEPAPARLVARFAITKESVSIGGGEGNDIIIPAPTVAAHHARIGLESGRYVITDLSQGHTAVSFGGDPAQLRISAKNALKDGSLVRLGETTLAFHQPEWDSPWLEMFYEVAGPVLTVGSVAGNDIVLAYPSVSPRHAELRQEAGRWVLRDLDSAQGTMVSYSGDPAEERRISANALQNGSIVRFGQVAFVFRIE